MKHPNPYILLERSSYGLLVGALFALISWDLESIPLAGLAGLLMGLGTGLMDGYVWVGWLRKRRFGVVILLKSIAYLAVILGVLTLLSGFFEPGNPNEGWRATLLSGRLRGLLVEGRIMTTIIVCFMILVSTQFVAQVSRHLGRNVLLKYITGQYYHPQEEERIFMFVDMHNSTAIAERIGNFQWHALLNDFFFDISRAIGRTKGEIYQYVGDEVVISWPREKGLKNLNCIRCFFMMYYRLEGRSDRYQRKYGVAPTFKAGLHIGKVVAGEIGDFKRSIVFHGDTINTASRIQSEANRLNRRLLLSERLLKLLDIEGVYTTDYIGKISLRGKAEEVVLYSLDPVE